MPLTKKALQRYKTLDKCLNKPLGKYTFHDLLDIVADELYDKCAASDGGSIRQLREDMRIMKARILNYGPDVEVLAPERLRNQISKKVEEMMKLYFPLP